jgi:tetratricopeptide (TPR) repeat protein
MKRIFIGIMFSCFSLFLFPSIGAAQSAQQGVVIFKQAQDMQARARSKDDVENALKKYEEAFRIFEKAGLDQPKGVTLDQIGAVYYSLDQYSRALEYHERSLAISRKISDVKSEGRTLNNIGNVYAQLGQYQKATEHMEKALAITKKIGDVGQEGTTLNSLAGVYHFWGQHQKAAEYYEKALVLRRKTGNVQKEGVTLNNIGESYRSLGQYSKALGYYERCLAITRKIGDVKLEGATLNNIGLIYNSWGQYPKALEYYEMSLPISRKMGDAKGEETSLNNIGLVYVSLGQYTKALEYYEQSLGIRQKIGDVRGEGTTLGNVGLVYISLGQYAKARDYFEQSLGIRQKIGDVKGEGDSLNYMGTIYDSLGQYTKALEYYEQSLAISKKIGDVSGEGATLSQIGDTYAQMGKYDEALKAANESLVIKEKIGVPVKGIKDSIANYYLDAGNMVKAEPLINEIKDDSTLGRLALIKSDFTSAQRHYEKDAKSAEKTGNTDWLFRSYTGLARAYEGMKDYPKAEEYYEKAMNQLEEIRSGLLPSERNNFFEVKVGGFARSEPAKGLARIRMKLNHPEASLTPGELTKARSFADHLTQTSAIGATNIPSSLMEKEQSYVNQLASLKKELAKTDPEKAPDKFKNLSKSVKDAKDELNSFVDKLWKDYPAYAAVKYPRPPSVKESALRPEECAVIFDVSSEGVGVILIRDKAVSKSFYLDIKLTDLERDVMRFREPFEKLRLKDYNPELAKSLYDKLLRPALVDVPKGTPLTIIPDGILAMLPFEALVTEGSATWNKSANGFDYPEGLTFLGDEHPIGYYQSVTALTLARTIANKEKPKDSLLVVADPVFNMKDQRAQQASETRLSQKEKEYNIQRMTTIEDTAGPLFPQLPETGKLAESLSKMYETNCLSITGIKADKLDFISKIAPKIDQFGSVVFATHGVMGNQVPGIMEPFLALTMVPPGMDGFLKMSDILSLKMNSDIVALTACQTGLGKDVSGEGVMSMGRAFQYAGARSVLMSLWSVADVSSVRLTESFFQHRKSGRSKLESLKLARAEIRKQGFEHPFFWAPFILVGEAN